MKYPVENKELEDVWECRKKYVYAIKRFEIFGFYGAEWNFNFEAPPFLLFIFL